MRKKILFVDDEVNILQGLRRMLRNMNNRWEMFFAGGGEEALDILSKNSIDVIVSDMRMPGMDGAQLLDRVMTLYPHIVRVVLSGYSDQEVILNSVKFTHQYLVKPCDVESLKLTIERSCLLRDLLSNKKLVETVTGIKRLPSLPRLYNMMITELQSPSTSLKKIGDIISQDVAMTAKILQLVNSAFFGLPQKVSSPNQAVALLGVNTLKGLILNVQIFSTYNSRKQSAVFSPERLWQHSIMVGSLAGMIARSESAQKGIEEDAFAAGMLHDIGKILLMEIKGCYERVGQCASEDSCAWHEAEYRIIGTSHAEVGAYLLGLWGISDPIVEAVAFHHNPAKLNVNKFGALTAVHLANALLTGNTDDPEKIDTSNIDMEHVSSLKMADRLEKWAGIYIDYRSRSSGANVKNSVGR